MLFNSASLFEWSSVEQNILIFLLLFSEYQKKENVISHAPSFSSVPPNQEENFPPPTKQVGPLRNQGISLLSSKCDSNLL